MCYGIPFHTKKKRSPSASNVIKLRHCFGFSFLSLSFTIRNIRNYLQSHPTAYLLCTLDNPLQNITYNDVAYFGSLKDNILLSFILIFSGILFVTKQIDYSRTLLGIFFILCTFFTTIERASIRIIMRRARKTGYNTKYTIFVGYSDGTEKFNRLIKENPHWGGYYIRGKNNGNIQTTS